MPRDVVTAVRLAAIATAAGAFSGSVRGRRRDRSSCRCSCSGSATSSARPPAPRWRRSASSARWPPRPTRLYGNVDLGKGLADRRRRRDRGRARRHRAPAADLRAGGGRRVRGAAGGLGRGADLLRWTRSTRPAWSRSASPPAWRAACSAWAAASCSCPALVMFADQSQLEARGHLAGRRSCSCRWWAPWRQRELRQRAPARRAADRRAVAARRARRRRCWPTPCRSARSSCRSPACSCFSPGNSLEARDLR